MIILLKYDSQFDIILYTAQHRKPCRGALAAYHIIGWTGDPTTTRLRNINPDPQTPNPMPSGQCPALPAEGKE